MISLFSLQYSCFRLSLVWRNSERAGQAVLCLSYCCCCCCCCCYHTRSLPTTLTCYNSYHSQSPESLFTHVPGLITVLPRSPSQAKGLLLSAILHSNDPVLFLEPKTLYRAAVEHVPDAPYTLPLCKAEVLRPGSSVSVVSYGAPLYKCLSAIEAIERDVEGASCELIDLRTVYPWDRECVLRSVQKTGRAVVVHESMVNAGVGAEVSAGIQEGAFLRLEAPIKRVAGWSTHNGLVFEGVNLPDVASECSLIPFKPSHPKAFSPQSHALSGPTESSRLLRAKGGGLLLLRCSARASDGHITNFS